MTFGQMVQAVLAASVLTAFVVMVVLAMAGYRRGGGGMPDYDMQEPPVRAASTVRLMSLLDWRCHYPVERAKYGATCNLINGHAGDHGSIEGIWRQRGGCI